MGDSDIDSFIAQQKAKLAAERQTLNDNKMNQATYRQQWENLHQGQNSERKQWDRPSDLKLTPSGRLDTNSIIQDVVREKDMASYRSEWRKLHQQDNSQNQTSPRIEKMKQGNSQQRLDTNSIIREVLGEKQAEQEPRRRRGDADAGLNLNPINTGNNMGGEDNYRRQWEQRQNQQNFASDPPRYGDSVAYQSARNIDNNIAQAQREVDDYRQKWEQMQGKSKVGVSPRSQGLGGRGGAVLIQDEGRLSKVKKMEEERNREYNELIAAKRNYPNNSGLRDQTDDFKSGTLPGNESDSVKWQKRKQRNEEYNEFLANKNQKDRHRFDDKRQAPRDSGQVNSLPHLNYSNSAQRRHREEERNREYNEMIQQRPGRQRGGPPDVKTGWGTPDYNDILAKKRANEQTFRRANDIAFEADPMTRQNNANGPPSVRRSQDQGGEYFASLPLGRNSESAQRRQKNQLGNDLKMQMAETQQARQLERREGILVNNNSILRQQPPAKATPRNYDPYYSVLKNVSDYDQLSPRANALLGRRQPTSERLRDKGGLNFNGDNGAGILDMGLFNKPRTTAVDPPAELVYQPSTFITANAIPTLNNSVDDAYNFYASKNPLDPDLKGDPVPQQGGGQRNVPSLNLSGVGGDLRGPASKVRFQDSRQNGPAQGMEFSTDDDRKKGKKQTSEDYREELKRQMAENDAKKRRAREERERYEMKMEEEAKYYDPFGKGGGGAPMRDATGNVISDLRQIRSDNLNPLSNRGGREVREVPSFNLPEKSPRGGNSYRDDLIGPPPTQTTAGGDPSFARGGHGIFGMPKTDVEKTQADKYKIDLKRQIEEKKAEEYRKKQLEKLEEEREQKLLDEQRARIQSEYEEEQRRTQEKKEEARRKNEEMMRAAEEKKRELERQKREEEDRRQEQIREQRDREMQERQREEEAKRGKSPPIPALRGKESNEEEKQEPEPKRTSHSPPIPAVRTRTPAGDESRQEHTAYPQRAQSADVLNQLTRLRAELRKESDRVQTMLHDQEDDVQIYDPRQIQRPPPGPVVVNPRTEIDVFETAKNRNPVVLRRTPNERANSRAVEDFNALKHKADTDSRKQFREMYPIEPTTSGALEAQQAALLQQQEERLRYMKDRRALEDTSALRVPGRDIHSSSSQLHSNSAFVDVNGIGHFPDDFEDIPRRNDSARYRRRTRIPSSPQIERLPSPDFNSRATFGSQTSLNVDKMARKNEDRLRKLRDLQGDDLSLYDPEDVLDRFMTKQGHNRPPSRNTLLDDTWMRAGSKRSEY